jgi:hypothetical protein
METLYANPETYRTIVAEAVAKFFRHAIFIRKSYATGERIFSLPHSSLPIDQGRVFATGVLTFLAPRCRVYCFPFVEDSAASFWQLVKTTESHVLTQSSDSFI